MGHFCRYCGRIRANEKFSGRGHRDHVCKDCQRLPAAERDYIDRLEELRGFLRQSIISLKNQKRLCTLVLHPDPEVRNLAEVIADVARLHPGRRRRIAKIAQKHWPVFVKTVQCLSEAEWWECFAPHDYGMDTRDGWLWEQYQRAKHIQFSTTPCWCGSGRAYWDCCADRDDEAVASAFNRFGDPGAPILHHFDACDDPVSFFDQTRGPFGEVRTAGQTGTRRGESAGSLKRPGASASPTPTDIRTM